MLFQLHKPYISVSNGSNISYGGNQMCSSNKTERSVGCGAVAALDLFLYLCRYHSDANQIKAKVLFPSTMPLDQQQYLALLHDFRRKYFPLIPGHGINGVSMAIGVNAFFLRYRLPFFAVWGVPYAKLWSSIREMLDQDIPVIFSVGPNFPLFWQHHQLRFYVQRSDGAFIPGPQTHAHYVTITGMDDQWIQIASWGRKYYINRSEYLTYVKEHSIRLVSNILYIRKKGHGVS